MKGKATSPKLGPMIGATLVCADIDVVITAYRQSFAMTEYSRTTISEQQAAFWQSSKLAGNTQVILQSPSSSKWLRIIEDKDATSPTPLSRYGWMSLEVNVADVEQTATKITDNFSVLGKPANLELSDAIKAMQVAGPVGEVLYLTEIKAAVPPFELPFTDAELDRLFIPVLKAPNRANSLAFYEGINQHNGISFNTKITVLNRFFNIDINHQYPVATIQFNGESLIEIDEVTTGEHHKDKCLPAGIALVTMQAKNIPADYQPLAAMTVENDPYYGNGEVRLYKGKAGELLEIMLTS
ncbi:hypothetical protein RGQ13_18835 [Thalassotalea psychrophila]|uniref:VOC domain-containing protein n=1 Tax=Thalassotalea psychrophila TaxID=3065647 RepID=A0ABY9TU01_9GAMM|nr:hypothetical protein RGQ13_18835 [Colwelliaceae bacterium SQ149]